MCSEDLIQTSFPESIGVKITCVKLRSLDLLWHSLSQHSPTFENPIPDLWFLWCVLGPCSNVSQHLDLLRRTNQALRGKTMNHREGWGVVFIYGTVNLPWLTGLEYLGTTCGLDPIRLIYKVELSNLDPVLMVNWWPTNFTSLRDLDVLRSG